MDQEGFIIVDDQGGEHEFPAGFDKTKAIAIVKGTPARNPLGVVQQRGGDTVNGQDTGEPDTWLGGFMGSIKDQGSELLRHLVPALDIAANPKTIGDFGNLAIPEMSGALGATAHAAAEPILTTGRTVERVGNATRGLETAATLVGGRTGLAASKVVPPMLEGGGRILQKAGAALKKTPQVMGEVVEDAGLPAGVKEGQFRGVTPQLESGTPAVGAPASSLEQKMLGMSDSPTAAAKEMATPPNGESVVNYTSEPTIHQSAEPDAQEMLGAMEQDPVESVMESQGMPMGKPRILNWKSGHGPSDELVGTMRDAEGSKETARRLGLSQRQVVAKTPAGPRQLPTSVQDKIRASIEGMTPEERLQYLADAPNGLTEAFIRSQLEP